jgi:hypothetical protein
VVELPATARDAHVRERYARPAERESAASSDFVVCSTKAQDKAHCGGPSSRAGFDYAVGVGDEERTGDEVPVESGAGRRGRGRAWWAIAALLAVLLAAVVANALGTAPDRRQSLAPGSSEAVPSATETTVVPETTVDTLIDIPIDTRVDPSAAPTDPAPIVGHGIGNPIPHGAFDPAGYCGTAVLRPPVVPNVVGLTLSEARGSIDDPFIYSMCTGSPIATVGFNVIAGECTLDPAKIDRIAAQRAVPGTLIDLTRALMMDMTLYEECAPGLMPPCGAIVPCPPWLLPPIPAISIPATSIPATSIPATTVPATSIPATSIPATTTPATTAPTSTSASVP